MDFKDVRFINEVDVYLICNYWYIGVKYVLVFIL